MAGDELTAGLQQKETAKPPRNAKFANKAKVSSYHRSLVSKVCLANLAFLGDLAGG